MVKELELNEDLSAIYSHIFGDGNMYIKKTNRSPSSRRTGRSDKPYDVYVIEYTNTCSELLDNMTNMIKNVNPNIYVLRSNNKFRIQARSKILFDFLKSLGYIDGSSWTIPDAIINNEKFRRVWLRAFFDDEGSIYSNCIKGFNTNKNAIITIQKMLLLENIETKIYTSIPKNPNYKTNYIIRIPIKYYKAYDKIGFNHTLKKEKYAEFLRKKCISRESNPDHSLGKAILYHSTTDAKI